MNMNKKIKKYISEWKQKDYNDDIPDEVPDALMDLLLAPSYKAICLAILKNDHSLKTLGFQPRVSSYYNELKKIEIQNRNIEYLPITISESLSIIEMKDIYKKYGIEYLVNSPTLFNLLNSKNY